MALSSIASAKSFFSLAFSSSSDLQPLGVRYIHAAVLGLPLVERRAADPVLAAHIRRLRPGLMLPQYPDDLFFGEPASASCPSPSAGDGLTHLWRRFRGSAHIKRQFRRALLTSSGSRYRPSQCQPRMGHNYPADGAGDTIYAAVARNFPADPLAHAVVGEGGPLSASRHNVQRLSSTVSRNICQDDLEIASSRITRPVNVASLIWVAPSF